MVGRNGRGQLTLSARGIAYVFQEHYIDLNTRLKAMDAAGVDIHALSLTSPMVYWAPPAFGLRLAQTYNDALATHVNGKNLDDKSLWQVYARCEALALPLYLHPPYDAAGVERMRSYYLRNFLGNPYDTGIAAASLMFGGVLDAYPKLDVVLPHGGGTFPWLIGRMDHGATVRPEVRHMKQPPSSYLRRFHYDTITHSGAILLDLVRLVGADRVVLGSDHPADMGYNQPLDVVERVTELTLRERELIIGGNSARLLKI